MQAGRIQFASWVILKGNVQKVWKMAARKLQLDGQSTGDRFMETTKQFISAKTKFGIKPVEFLKRWGAGSLYQRNYFPPLSYGQFSRPQGEISLAISCKVFPNLPSTTQLHNYCSIITKIVHCWSFWQDKKCSFCKAYSSIGINIFCKRNSALSTIRTAAASIKAERREVIKWQNRELHALFLKCVLRIGLHRGPVIFAQHFKHWNNWIKLRH